MHTDAAGHADATAHLSPAHLSPEHLSLTALESGLDQIRESPAGQGTVALVVRRPAADQREVLAEGQLDPAAGLVGDAWRDGKAEPDRQVTLMNARLIGLLAGSRDRWPLAGDQLYVDLDLSEQNLPPGTRLAVGAAELEVTADQHRGCKKFAARYGLDALRFVNSPDGYALRLRGMYARVVRGGAVRPGDPVRRLAHPAPAA